MTARPPGQGITPLNIAPAQCWQTLLPHLQRVNAAAQIALETPQQSGELAQLTASVDLAKAQLAVSQTETAGESIFRSGWRPFIGRVRGAAFTMNHIGAPPLTWLGRLFGGTVAFPTFDAGMIMPVPVGIAIQRAETYRALRKRTAELQQSLDYQGAIIDVLKVIWTSAGDTQPVFDRILNQAMNLCGCMFAALHEFDGTLMHARATIGFEPEILAPYMRRFPMPPTRATGPGRANPDRTIHHVRDIPTDPEVTTEALI